MGRGGSFILQSKATEKQPAGAGTAPAAGPGPCPAVTATCYPRPRSCGTRGGGQRTWGEGRGTSVNLQQAPRSSGSPADSKGSFLGDKRRALLQPGPAGSWNHGTGLTQVSRITLAFIRIPPGQGLPSGKGLENPTKHKRLCCSINFFSHPSLIGFKAQLTGLVSSIGVPQKNLLQSTKTCPPKQP